MTVFSSTFPWITFVIFTIRIFFAIFTITSNVTTFNFFTIYHIRRWNNIMTNRTNTLFTASFRT
jgi:hypothetical protein